MLRQIRALKNVGLFRDGASPPVPFDRVTLIYGDNGRGKSTLSSILRACSKNDRHRVLARRTIDVTEAPSVVLMIDRAGTEIPVVFNGTAWVSVAPELAVFDSEFVEENVYSGFEVRAEQRQSLLDFALGEKAVALKAKVDDLTRRADGLNRPRGETVGRLEQSRGPFDLPAFIKLDPVPEIERRIDAQRKRIEAARKVQVIQGRAVPVTISVVTFDVQAFFATLARGVDGIQVDAERAFRAHAARHPERGFEDWVSRGQAFAPGDECPFCGQGVRGLDLIRTYRSYFSEAYSALKRDVAALDARTAERLGAGVIAGMRGGVERNAALIAGWHEDVEVHVVPIDLDAVRVEIDSLRENLAALAARKQALPLEVIGTEEDRVDATRRIERIAGLISDYNAGVGHVGQVLDEFKRNLAGEDVQALETELRKLSAIAARQSPEVVELVKALNGIDAERAALDKEKAATRTELDTLMKTTLDTYQGGINALLAKFGADFKIGEIGHDYRGTGEPRMEYGLVVRTKPVKLGTRLDPSHCFATALSEGDKRTLAFAFFVAKLQADPDVAGKVVVLDDPVCSLDSSRRTQTIHLIAEFCRSCRQVIVLAHNAYFLRDLKVHLGLQRPTIPAAVLGIIRGLGQYSAFGPCDLDEECASEYHRNHVLIGAFVEGTSNAARRDVAKAVRPLLEGYLHRRFPRHIARRQMFGAIIGQARAAIAPSPLVHLHSILQELSEINDYAGQFHHDTNAAADAVPVVDGELLAFARRAMQIIYKGAP